MDNGKKAKGMRHLFLAAGGIFLTLFLISAGYLLYSGIIEQKSEEQYAELRTLTVAVENVSTKKPEPDQKPAAEKTNQLASGTLYEIPEKNIDFTALQSENKDIYAWIYIPGTKVDYPILQHPKDDTYYLNYNIDGSKGYPGAIYSELCNSKDFTDKQTVLYGHNMKNKTMFGSLHNYEDAQFFQQNNYIYIYTEKKNYIYQIFAAYEYSSVHLVYGFDFTTPEIFQSYIDGIFANDNIRANINHNVPVTSADKLLTLTTCISGKPDNRYLVQGVLLNP